MGSAEAWLASGHLGALVAGSGEWEDTGEEYGGIHGMGGL